MMATGTASLRVVMLAQPRHRSRIPRHPENLPGVPSRRDRLSGVATNATAPPVQDRKHIGSTTDMRSLDTLFSSENNIVPRPPGHMRSPLTREEFLERQVADLKKEMETMKDSVRKARQAEQQANRSVDAAAAQLEIYKKEIKEAEHGDKRTVVVEFKNLRRENAQLQGKVSDVQRALKKSQAELVQAQARIAELERDCSS